MTFGRYATLMISQATRECEYVRWEVILPEKVNATGVIAVYVFDIILFKVLCTHPDFQ